MAKFTVTANDGTESVVDPEQVATEIIDAANKSVLVEISGVRGQELAKIVRYKHAREIYSKGEKYAEKMLAAWQSEVFEKFIEGTFKQQEKVIAKAETDAKLEYFSLLVARGTDKATALEMSGL